MVWRCPNIRRTRLSPGLHRTSSRNGCWTLLRHRTAQTAGQQLAAQAPRHSHHIDSSLARCPLSSEKVSIKEILTGSNWQITDTSRTLALCVCHWSFQPRMFAPQCCQSHFRHDHLGLCILFRVTPANAGAHLVQERASGCSCVHARLCRTLSVLAISAVLRVRLHNIGTQQGKVHFRLGSASSSGQER